MDLDAFKNNLRMAVALLPPDILEKVGDLMTFAFDNMGRLSEVGPQIIGLLRQDFLAAFVASQTGGLETDELEKVVRDVFAEFGIKPKVA